MFPQTTWRLPVTLTIAGSDSSGGAGIQADLKTFSALSCYGMSVITAITAQNTQGIQAVSGVSPECVRAQLHAVLSDIKTDAIKTGMLYSTEIVAVLVDYFKNQSVSNLVVDPVMLSSSGTSLLDAAATTLLIEQLFPQATVVTPNRTEASALLKRALTCYAEVEEACQELLAMGMKAVLLKGGDFEEHTSSDCLSYYEPSGQLVVKWFSSPRLQTRNTHGTGCTLSSAITAYLARGLLLQDAVSAAKTYLTGALNAGRALNIGKGKGPLQHFWKRNMDEGADKK
ncbi:bifunctional hydroxymethylpyrimidine kinase/phosphomethylpyrimidine kinase [Deltaproteobacteria bacterium TL4]